MTSYMTIMVRVVSNQAQARMAALQASQRGLNNEVRASNRSEPLGQRHISSLSKFGNQLQWTGRMLQYNFTLPLAAAGVAATKFYMDQEKAMTHVAKVYGDTEEAAKQFRRELGLGREAAQQMAESIKTDELEALDNAFTAMSNHYAVQKSEILEVAGAWAAAGQSGAELAKSVNATMQAIIIGDMDANDATKALISIQAQYNMSSEDLMKTLANLNSIENQTSASMSDLITGFEKAAGVARSAGIPAEELAAHIAALVPASGSAANAGNALKTIYSRLIAPTKETTQVLGYLGFATDTVAWNSATAGERLQLMAEKFGTMSSSAKNAASSVIASRWQVNRFDILMKELINTHGNYAKAVSASEHQGESFRRMQDELNTVLESDPKALSRTWVMLQNAMVKIIIPLIPYILYLADSVAKLAGAFADMNPYAQKFVLLGLVMLAFVGPLVRYSGALVTLLGVLGVGFIKAGSAIGFMGGMLLKLLLPFRMMGTVVMGALGLVGSGIATLLTVGFGSLAAFLAGSLNMITLIMGSFGVAVPAVMGSVVTGLLLVMRGPYSAALFLMSQRWTVALVAMVTQTGVIGAIPGIWASVMGSIMVIQSGGLAILVRSWAMSIAYMMRGTAVLGGMSTIITSAMAAAGAAMSAGFVAFGAISIAFTQGFAAMWYAFWGHIGYVMRNAQLAMYAAWTTFQTTFLMGWGFFHTGMIAIVAWFQRTWLALQVAGYRAWTAIVAAGNAAVATIERGWMIVRAGLYRAWAATTLAIQATFWRGMALLTTVGTRAVAALWAMMSVNIVGSLKALYAFAARMMVRLIAVMTGPWGIAIAVVVGILYAFRDQIAQIWNNIVSYFAGEGGSIGDIFSGLGKTIMGVFNALPQGVQNAMVAVVTIVRDAALAVYDWFSYINPFAHHSPSLVENVENGMNSVNKSFSKLGNIKKYTSAAYAEVKRFGALTAKLGVSQQAAENADNRKTLKKAGAGQALGSYNRLVGILAKLNPILKQVESRMNAQQAVVDRWQKKVDTANDALDRQQNKLTSLQGTLDKYQNKLSAAEDKLQTYASTPLEGMREMENQIFRNELAQTKLRYEMMKLEDVGGTYDELKSKIEAINGAQEILRGTQSDLRAQGAGSEILGQYDKEMSKLDQQKDKYAEAAGKLADMQVRLDALQREADRLDLVKAMKFDELQHKIDLAADSMKEMPFDEIMAGMKGANAEISKYSPMVDKATKAVNAQQAVVDRMTKSRDKLQTRLDREQNTLDQIKDRYDSVNDAIQAVESSLQDVVSAANSANQALEAKKSAKKELGKKGGAGGAAGDGYISPGLQNVLNAGNSGFPDPGGKGIPARTDWSSQVGDINNFTDQMAFDTASLFSDLNPFAPLKEKAIEFWNWTKSRFGEGITVLKGMFGNMFDGVSFGGGGGDFFGGVLDSAKGIGEYITGIIRDVAKVFKWAWDLIGPEIIKFGKGTWEGLKSIWEQVGPELAKFGELIKPLGEAFQNAWTIMKPILAIIAGAILGLMKVVGSMVAETVGPLLSAVGTVLAGLIKIIRGFVQIVVGIFTLDLGMILRGVGNIFVGLVKIIWGILKGAVNLIWQPIKGLVKGIYGFFVWLWDVLVGHSVIPDIVEGIFFWFDKLKTLAVWVYNHVVLPVARFFKFLFDKVIAGLRLWWAGVLIAWGALKAAGKWIWDNVLLPVWNVIKGLWSNYVGPALRAWWGRMKNAWSALKTVGKWFWENVIKPVWERVKRGWDRVKDNLKEWFGRVKKLWGAFRSLGKWFWENIVKPVWDRVKNAWIRIAEGIKLWYGRFKTIWSAFKALGRWFWDNVIKPVWDRVVSAWSKIRDNISQWFTRFKNIWNSLKGLGAWFKTNVMDPVFDKIKSVWNSIKSWLENNKDMLLGPAKGLANGIRIPVNFVIGGLNKVADVLPGVSWNIPGIPKFEEGGVPGRKATRGFKTAGARAIVGEGKANYPEFVIPTDPTYRNRAIGLMMQAGSKLGMFPGGDMGDMRKAQRKAGPNTQIDPKTGLPAFGIGGFLSDKWKDVKGATGKALSKLKENTVGRIMDPILRSASGKVKKAAGGYAPFSSPPLYGIEKIRSWVTEADKKVNESRKKAKQSIGGGPAIQRALKWARTQNGKPYQWGGGGNPSWDCSGFMGGITHVIRGQAPGRVGATSSFPWDGFKPGAQPKGFTIGSTPNYGGTGVGHMAGTLGGVNVESRGGRGVIVGPGARGYNDSGFSQVYHLAKGGVAKARRGGVLANIGEGGYDEAVVPLPRDWRSSLNTNTSNNTEKKTYNFYGDLSFPNITDPNDAQTFLDNLDALAKD